jgi:peptidoglycan hydrolase-like protein with peptidoglycan-binding domain
VHNTAGHMVILGGAGFAACVLSLAIAPDRQAAMTPADETAVVVTLPQRASNPIARTPTPQQVPGAQPSSGDRGSVTRQLQSELKRVGCYDGEVNGVWTTSSRLAMKSFTDLVNAKLPIEKPDPILLALVQGHQERVCAVSRAADKVPDKPEAAETKPGRTTNPPSAGLPAVAAAAPKLISPPTEAVRPAAPPRAAQKPPASKDDPQPPPGSPQTPDPAAGGPPPEHPLRTARPDGPVPSVGVYERRPRQFRRRTPSQQIAYARSLFRGLKRAVTSSLPLP